MLRTRLSHQKCDIRRIRKLYKVFDEAKAADQKVEFIIDQNSDSSWWLENICVRKANAAGDEQFAV